jgi:hypothetical protein
MVLKAIASLLFLLWMSLLGFLPTSWAFEYTFNGEAEGLGLSITDVTTGISNVQTLFIDEIHSVSVQGVEWMIQEDVMTNNTTSTEGFLLLWSTMVDGTVVATGNVSLTDLGQLLPTSIDAGTFTVTSNGKHTVEVIMTINGDIATELIVSDSYVAYQAGVSIIPMILVLIMAMMTQMV